MSPVALIGAFGAGLEADAASFDRNAMQRGVAAIGEDGILACACEDGEAAMALLTELIDVMDLHHPAALTLCRVYEAALAGIAEGRFVTARRVFQALLET